MLCTAPVLEYLGKDLATAYASRSLHKAEMFAIKTFKNYVYRNKFTIVTDHKPLLWLKLADNNTRVQKWRLKLSNYEFDIVYKPGKQNANADCNIVVSDHWYLSFGQPFTTTGYY